MGISVIIPTFDNIEYIDETLDSIYKSGKDLEYEILIGIDGCNKSLKYLKDKTYPDNTKIFFFPTNKGPYLIKNTLSTLAKYDNLLFFDSDDMMEENMIEYCLKSLDKYQCVKPRLRNFRIIDGKITNESNRKNWGEGVFAIHKKIFDYHNGFEGWLVAADSDFMNRLYKNNTSVELTQEILLLRRLHDKGLTSRPDTGLRSSLRSKYASISKSKKYFGPLPELKIAEYKPIEIAEYAKKSVIAVEDIIIYDGNDTIIYDGNDNNSINDRKQMVNDVINAINNKKQKTKDVVPEKKPMIIDYEKVNKLLKNRVIPNPTPKVKKVDDSTKNKKSMSNSEMVKIIFPGKPNRRNDGQTMTFGKK
jgi:glycosyltransferase involved in cell wall biosynthesis